jgi:hypothetical protein
MSCRMSYLVGKRQGKKAHIQGSMLEPGAQTAILGPAHGFATLSGYPERGATCGTHCLANVEELHWRAAALGLSSLCHRL